MLTTAVKVVLGFAGAKLHTSSNISMYIALSFAFAGLCVNTTNICVAIWVAVNVNRFRGMFDVFTNVYGPGICSSLKVIEERIIVSTRGRINNGTIKFVVGPNTGRQLIGASYRTNPDNNMMKVGYMRETATWYRSMYTCAIATAAIGISMVMLLVVIAVIGVSTSQWAVLPVSAALVLSFINFVSTLVWWHVGKHVVTHYHWRAAIMAMVKQEVKVEVEYPAGSVVECIRYFGTQDHPNDNTVLPHPSDDQQNAINSSRERLGQAISDFESIRSTSCTIIAAAVAATLWIVYSSLAVDGRKTLASNTSAAALSLVNIFGVSLITNNIQNLFNAKENSRLSLKIICIANKMYGADGVYFETDIASDVAVGFGALRYKLDDANEWTVRAATPAQKRSHYTHVNHELQNRVMQNM